METVTGVFMEFCPKCGSVILVEGNKSICASCKYKPKGRVKLQTSEKIESVNRVAVIDERKVSTYPIVEIKCKKCKNKKAYFWTMQTRTSDESETKFYKCVKCNNTWREYR
jgi:transcription factor S